MRFALARCSLERRAANLLPAAASIPGATPLSAFLSGVLETLRTAVEFAVLASFITTLVVVIASIA